MPSKPLPRERYKQRALHFLDKSAKSLRIMTRRYEELGRLQDYLKHYPKDAVVRAAFEAKKKAFLESNRVRDRLQQAAVAYGNYRKEPGVEPIQIKKSDLRKATRGYYGKQLRLESSTKPPALPGPPAPEPMAHKPIQKPKAPAKPTSIERLESMIKDQFAELRNTTHGGNLIAGPLLRYVAGNMSPAANASLYARLRKINQLLNADRIPEAARLFEQTSMAITKHNQQHTHKKKKGNPATKKESGTKWKKIKERAKKIWNKMRTPFSFSTRVKRQPIGKALSLIITRIRAELKGSAAASNSVAVIRNALGNSGLPEIERKKLRETVNQAARAIEEGRCYAAVELLEQSANSMKDYVVRIKR